MLKERRILEMKKMYLVGYDVWGNADAGFDVNPPAFE